MNELNETLAKPVMSEQTDTERKLKNNLIAFSLISIFIHFGNISVEGSVSISGLKLTGLTPVKIQIGLLLIILYSALHYLWCVSDALKEWRLRLTAVGQMSLGVANPSYSVPPAKSISNNTFYYWWAYHSKELTKIESNAHQLDSSMTYFRIKGDEFKDIANSHEHILKLDEYNHYLDELSKRLLTCTEYLGRVEAIMSSPPVSVSLPRFDNYFRSFLVSQNFRWLFFDYIIPFSLGSFSLYFLSEKVSPYLIGFIL
ncbi:hypothetical protein [Aeromonas hydrophila]|uniref:hypothetical protein n=1 Tax=Aeromonas hydrophila TaxID=644 RepID=UPI003D2073BF